MATKLETGVVEDQPERDARWRELRERIVSGWTPLNYRAETGHLRPTAAPRPEEDLVIRTRELERRVAELERDVTALLDAIAAARIREDLWDRLEGYGHGV